MITLDPGLSDDLPFAAPAPGSQGQQQPEQSAPASPFDDDGDGTLNPHEDLGQAGTEPDQGPAVGPTAGSGEHGAE